MRNILLLLSESPDDELFGSEVAKRCDLEFVQIPNAGRIGASLMACDMAIVLFDFGHPEFLQAETMVRDLCIEHPAKVSANSIHYITSPEKLTALQSGNDKPVGGNFVVRKYGENPKEAADHFARVVRACSSRAYFGLQNHLSSGTPILTYRFDNSDQRSIGVKAAEKYVLEMGCPPKIATAITNAVDELLMNAIFDASTDEDGKQVYSRTPRNSTILLPNRKSVEMHLGIDGEYIAISIVDYFGSLDRDTILKHVIKVLNGGYTPNTSVQNAGLGLSMVFRSGGSFFFVSHSQVKTEVCVFFKKTRSFRDFQSQFQFVSTQIFS